MELHTAKSKQKHFYHINTESFFVENSQWYNHNISDLWRQYIGYVN